MTSQALIQSAAQRGWLSFPTTVMTEAQIDRVLRNVAMRRQRAKYRAAGLNQDGKPYMRKARPELRGLPRRKYLTAYMALWRAQHTHAKP